ncbi:MAG: DNA-processing protein DprA [Candidatus Falkowbacteria bacterium]|nr:DNA-processing protein DprA [Candidatus Falkowbacteria bacterium]
MEGIEYLVALSHFEHFGPRRLKFLFNYFGSWQKAWEANSKDLIASGVKESNVNLLLDHRAKIKPDELLKNILDEGIKLLTLDDSLYPPLLREIYAPPPLIYYQGELNKKLFLAPLAIVGTRKATSYGQHATEKIISELAASNITIVSGLALGIDTLAHQLALENNLATVAWLGCGVDQVYPRANKNLAQKIINNGGAIMSEFPPKTEPHKSNFPRRNRLIAGTCFATLVIEAAEKSGALITARYALEENREVMAIPGPIYNDSSIGTNNLLKSGAKPITEANDIISGLNLANIDIEADSQKSLNSNDNDEKIIELLKAGPQHIDLIAKETKLDINVINSRLTIMEIKGLVKNLGNMQYIRNKPMKINKTTHEASNRRVAD